MVFADEMRLGQVRRVWGRRGWRIELGYAWVYGVLGVDAMWGRLWWDWVKRVRGGGDSSGTQGVEGDRREGRGGIIRPFTKRR